MLENFLSLACSIGWVGVPFFKHAMIPNVLWVFSSILRNWDPLKDMRRLPHVDPSDRGMTLTPSDGPDYERVLVATPVPIKEHDLRALIMKILNMLKYDMPIVIYE